MEWNNFTESKKEYPEQIVYNLINGFSKATSNLLEIQINSVSDFAGDLYVDFEFRVLLLSNTIKSYQFEIFRFGYNVDIFPAFSILEESIFQELTGRKMKMKERLEHRDEAQFNEYLQAVFKTKRFEEVVSGLMKISKKYTK